MLSFLCRVARRTPLNGSKSSTIRTRIEDVAKLSLFRVNKLRLVQMSPLCKKDRKKKWFHSLREGNLHDFLYDDNPLEPARVCANMRLRCFEQN